MLSTEQARRFYDRFGARQDKQAFYEDAAIARLAGHLPWSEVHSVLELGCGTGRFAASLLGKRIPSDATYLGLDISSTMVDLSRRRLEPWGPRAEVRQIAGSPALDELAGPFDCFVCAYVLDLLPEDEIDFVLRRARKLLGAGGRAGIITLSPGQTPFSALVTSVWRLIHRVRPQTMGGCRPLELRKHINPAQWRIDHASRVTSWGVTSEVFVLAPESLNIASD